MVQSKIRRPTSTLERDCRSISSMLPLMHPYRVQYASGEMVDQVWEKSLQRKHLFSWAKAISMALSLQISDSSRTEILIRPYNNQIKISLPRLSRHISMSVMRVLKVSSMSNARTSQRPILSLIWRAMHHNCAQSLTRRRRPICEWITLILVEEPPTLRTRPQM